MLSLVEATGLAFHASLDGAAPSWDRSRHAAEGRYVHHRRPEWTAQNALTWAVAWLSRRKSAPPETVKLSARRVKGDVGHTPPQPSQTRTGPASRYRGRKRPCKTEFYCPSIDLKPNIMRALQHCGACCSQREEECVP